MERKKIADALFELLDKLGKTDDDKSYIAYICFCTLGSILLKMYGEDKFNELIADIKSKYEDLEQSDSNSNCH